MSLETGKYELKSIRWAAIKISFFWTCVMKDPTWRLGERDNTGKKAAQKTNLHFGILRLTYVLRTKVFVGR